MWLALVILLSSLAKVHSGSYSFARSVLITGSNRGQGLEWVRQLKSLPRPPEYIFATCRKPEDRNYARDLRNIAAGSARPRIMILKLDVTNVTEIKSVARTVESTVGANGLTVLINNAGYFDRQTVSLDAVTKRSLSYTYDVNAVGPVLMAQALHDLLRRAARRSSIKNDLKISRAAIINISSVMSSIRRSTGGYYSYRMSKTALNMATKSMAGDLKKEGIMAVAFHPGWVKTAMGGPSAKITTSRAILDMMHTLSRFNKLSTGKFYARTGNPISY